MNPGLVIKLRPAGPWRIGPDTGARNRVDVIFHSDSLYSAVTLAMARLDTLEPWLDATARAAAPAVCFSSCFPFLDEIGYVIPPRTLWPPTSPGLMSARVRWKSARFVPLGLVQAMLAGQRLDENHWSVDGASECLVPAGVPGPFRSGIRRSAAVDRLTGNSERHSTACLEFRPGAGLWTIASFLDDAARDRWLAPVKAAFRLLADTGFGGERSRGWGRSETPEFVEGSLPDMIVAAGTTAAKPEVVPEPEPAVLSAAVKAPPVIEPLSAEIAGTPAEPQEPPAEPPPDVPEPVVAVPAVAEEPAAEAAPPETPAPVAAPAEEPAAEAAPSETPAPATAPAEEPAPEASPSRTPAPATAYSEEPVAEAAHPDTPAPATAPPEEPAAEAAPPEPSEPVAAPVAAAPEPSPTPAPGPQHLQFWLLSLFTPAPADSVDWQLGNYTVLARGGRIESAAGSGELKKQLQMVEEGSVLRAAAELRGAASDVAPDGFAHPVFRAGFAVSIPLPEVS